MAGKLQWIHPAHLPPGVRNEFDSIGAIGPYRKYRTLKGSYIQYLVITKSPDQWYEDEGKDLWTIGSAIGNGRSVPKGSKAG